jgi:hypothetical protein
MKSFVGQAIVPAGRLSSRPGRLKAALEIFTADFKNVQTPGAA